MKATTSIFRGGFVQQLIRERFPFISEYKLNEIVQSDSLSKIAAELIRILDLIRIYQPKPKDEFFNSVATMDIESEPFSNNKSVKDFKQKLLNLKRAFEKIPSDPNSEIEKWFHNHPLDQQTNTVAKYQQLKKEMVKKIETDIEQLDDLIRLFKIETRLVKGAQLSLHKLFADLLKKYHEKNKTDELRFSEKLTYDFDSNESPFGGAKVNAIKLMILAKALFNHTVSSEAMRKRIAPNV